MESFQNKIVESYDGTKISYQVVSENGPVMILANGLGGNVITWKYLIDFFKSRFKIMSWDYRGLYTSHAPENPHSLTIPDQCLDLKAILDKEHVEKAILFGWSMGVQVNFEFYKLYPDKVGSIVAINGAYGNPFDKAFHSPVLNFLLPIILWAIQKNYQKLIPYAPYIVSSRRFPSLIKLTGLVAETLDEDILYDLAQDFIKLDFWYYAETFKQIANHNAKSILKQIKVPTLIIAGSKDLFTPVDVSHEMFNTIPQSELMIAQGGSHYTPIEYPELINLRIEKFFRQRLQL